MPNLVAIVGRPNVGKSTLFNRLVAERKAIVDDQPGVTRDRHYGQVAWGSSAFTIIDTGGYVPGSEDVFEKGIIRQAQLAMEEATVLLFVVDSQVGLTPLDEEVANILRRSKKPVLVVANKADNTQLDWATGQFHQLGMHDLFAVSATNGFGTGDLLDAVVTHLNPDLTTAIDDLPRLALLGKPNVGKSSLLNALLGEERSMVTPIAGTTRDALHTTYNKFGKHFTLVDTAGLRRKSRSKEDVEFFSTMRAIKALQQADVCLTLLDATDGVSAQDLRLLALADRYKKGQVLLVNKWDLVEKDAHTAQAYTKNLHQQLATLQYIPVLFISALNKQRIFQAMDKALEVYESRQQRIPTAKLNDVMLNAIAAYPPPMTKGKLVKIKYITQLPVPTPTFAFFCNLPQYILPSYQRYLENQLRKHFSFEGVPLSLVFRKK